MVKIKNVSKSYKKGNKVIDNINLEIKDGEIFGFIGQNGAGKTTTIKMMTGILEIDEGDIFIDGKSISQEPIEAKNNIGLVSDNPDVFYLECNTDEEYNQVADKLRGIPEEVYEATNDETFFMQDKTASIEEKERLVKYRKIDRSIIKTLKEYYDYRDEITGEKIGSEYGDSVVEAHHIDYFTVSQNNDTTNIIIISPNYHRIIHKNNPIFNRKKYQFEFPNGEVLQLKLYDHLQIKI